MRSQDPGWGYVKAGLVGAVVAALVVLSFPVVAAVGGNFILGNANTADAVTSLSGSSAASLRITNTRASSPALDLQVASGAPLKVNSATRIPLLNADRLDGHHASFFAAVTHSHDASYVSVVADPTAGNFPKLTADGELVSSVWGPWAFTANMRADCPPGTTVGGYGRNGPFCSTSMGFAALAPAGTPAGYFSMQTSMVLDPTGRPVVTFQGAGGVSLLRCNDPQCAGGDESVQVIGDGLAASLALDASLNPVILYVDTTGWDLKLVRCNDPNCAGGDESVFVLEVGLIAAEVETALVLDGSGFPVFVVTDGPEGLLFRCYDQDCTDYLHTPLLGVYPSSPSLVLDPRGHPVVAYSSGSVLFALRVFRCGSVWCNLGEPYANTDVAVDGGGLDVSLALDWAGNPVIAYDAIPDGLYDHKASLRVAHCNDPACAGGDESIQTVDSVGNTGRFPSLQLDDNGWPVIAYYDRTNRDPKLAHCNDPNCAGGDEYILEVEPPLITGHGEVDTYAGLWPSLVLDRAGHPVIAYYDNSGSPVLKLAAYVG